MKITTYTRFIFSGLCLILSQISIFGESQAELPKLKGHYFTSNIPEFKGNSQKGPVFNNPEFYLHGFFLDYTKLKPIFEHGLLSVEELEKRGIIASLPFSKQTSDNKISGWCNGRNQISLSSVRLMNEMPPCYEIENAMTLVIQGISLNDSEPNGCSAGSQEVRVDDIIPPQYFVGVIIPLNVLNQTIDKIKFMEGYGNAEGGAGLRELVASKMKHLQEDLAIEDADLSLILTTLNNEWFTLSIKGYNVMTERINKAIRRGFEQKFNRSQRLITFWDVIKPLLPANFPVYDENGDLIEDIWEKEGYEMLISEIRMPEGW